MSSLFCSFLTKKCETMKNDEKQWFFSKKHIRAARVFLVLEKSTIICASVAFWIPESCVISCCAPCRLEPMVLCPVRPSVIEGSTQWWQEWILSLHPCLVRPLHCLSLPVLKLFWWIDEVPCFTWPTTTWVPDVPFFCQLLSDVWHRVASFVKTKSVLIGFSLNILNRMK